MTVELENFPVVGGVVLFTLLFIFFVFFILCLIRARKEEKMFRIEETKPYSFLFFGIASLSLLTLFGLSLLIGPEKSNLPEFATDYKVFINEDSLAKEAETKYGYHLLSSEENDEYSLADNVYHFEEENGKVISCSLIGRNQEAQSNVEKPFFKEKEKSINVALKCD